VKIFYALLRGLASVLVILTFSLGASFGQERSVRPGINDPFKNPDVKEYIGKFETESRDIYVERKRILDACPIKPAMTVADIGAGTGLFTRMFARAVGPEGKVYAVDIAPKFIEHIDKTCKEDGLKNVTGVVCTPTSVELPNNSIDLAFICDTYHHFEFPHKTMASIHRALRPGGKVVVIDFRRIEGKSREWVLNHVRAGQEVVTKEIVSNGFKLLEEKKFLEENYCLVFEKQGNVQKGGHHGDEKQVEKTEQGTPPAVPAISDRLRQYVATHEIAGAVTLVATPDRIIHFDEIGNADLDRSQPMRTDSIFWIASMSKPILATLVLMLQDEGLLSVDDPVEKYLPEFKALKTVDGKSAPITIRHLLTHTSGMGEITPVQARECKTLASVIPLYVARPVGFTPGTKWAYCQSGINTGGRIAEVVTGEPLEKLLKRRLFDPLGMKDTTFYLSEEQLSRLAKSYRRTAKGDLEATAIGFLNGKSPTSTDRFPAPNGGLFSTATDYARFCRMILRGGELDGKRYLKPETVKLMTTIQTGDLKTGFTAGNGWGLGWCVVREPQGITAMLSPGTFGHGGAFGTQAWIDPGVKRIYILMVQRANFPNSDASEVRKGFQEAAGGAFANLKGK
jgi:CubicO group peptidase (beta-lactamase class C family)/ubiquinone/menaquinone biosynthesis C-methylase UbiE